MNALFKKIPAKVTFYLIGISSTIWFLVRVIPKPSRAAYPCMRAAAPIMSGFVIYLLGIVSSVVAIKKARTRLKETRYLAAGLFLLVAVVAASVALPGSSRTVYANSGEQLESNTPVGEARGIFPGRVVWSWDPDATNEDCTNKFGDAWDLPHNTDLHLVEAMCADAINNLVGTTQISDAWDTLFRHFNEAHNKGSVPYTAGEKVFIKMNFVGGHRSRLNDDHSRKEHSRYGNSQSSPQVGLAILRQLINEYGVAQEDISIGDPSKNIYKSTWDLWTAEFPEVHYIAELDEMERTMAVAGENPAIYYSDRGTILESSQDYLCSALEEADYLINISALKGHMRAGVTLNAKNHYGSHMSANASHLHPGLVGYNGATSGYGKYRTLVDLMGHEKLGENSLLFIIDGLWSGPDANLKPVKWQMYPFNNDWTSSILMSQDHVAIESVCFDFLRNEYTVENSEYPYPQIPGTEDYLLQAADSTYWPEGIIYDPELDGTPIKSMGVYESWNNADLMEYSRNLGTGEGIELVKLFGTDTPGPPKNLHFEFVTDSVAMLVWQKNENKTTHYSIERSIGNDLNYEQIGIVDSAHSSFEVAGEFNSELYYYRLKAINGEKFSGYSTSLMITRAIPLAPSNLHAVALEGGQAHLSWESNSSIEKTYVIESSFVTTTNFQPLDTIPADSTEYRVTGLVPLSFYYFRVKALNQRFASEYSNWVRMLSGPATDVAEVSDVGADVAVYPNPFREVCTLKIRNRYTGPVRIKVYSLGGIKKMEMHLNKGQEELSGVLDLSGYPAGTYLVQFNFGGFSSMKKIYKAD